MHERPEGAALHGVLEIARRVEGRDLRGEVLVDAEMAPAPGHFLAEVDEAGRPSGHGGLAGMRQRLHVQVEIACGVEAALQRRIDPGLDDDGFHRSSVGG